MARRLFVDGDGNITGDTFDNDASTPADHTAVSETTITNTGVSDVIVGGTWISGVYTAPGAQEFEPDGSTDTGKLQIASFALHNAYDDLAARNDGPLAREFTDPVRAFIHTVLAQAHPMTYRVMNGSGTVNQKLAWAAANGAGPSDVPIDNRINGLILAEGWTAEQLTARTPTGPICFAHPGTAVRWNFADCWTNSQLAAVTALLADLPADDTEWRDGVWIPNLTA